MAKIVFYENHAYQSTGCRIAKTEHIFLATMVRPLKGSQHVTLRL